MNSYKNYLKLFIYFFIFESKLNTFSIVYNLKISQTTRRQAPQEDSKHSSIASLTFDSTFRKRYDGADQSILGVLASVIYSPTDYYLRADFAFGRVKHETCNFQFSKLQTDDILLTAGLSKNLTEHVKVTYSWLLGFPTHNDPILVTPVQLGTGHFSLGFQVDGSFFHDPNRENSFFVAGRFIYFFPKTLDYHLNNNDLKFDFDLGNLADLFISHQNQWDKNKIEYGYNLTVGFGANILPRIAEVEKQETLIRNSLFITYAKGFLICNHMSGIILGLSYGFDVKPKIYGSKRTLSAWASWGVNF